MISGSMTDDRPRPGDLIVRPHGGAAVSVFVLTVDQCEHALKGFETHVDALAYATRVAEQAGVDLWEAHSWVAPLTRVRTFPPAG
jgi:hypothetical protein